MCYQVMQVGDRACVRGVEEAWAVQRQDACPGSIADWSTEPRMHPVTALAYEVSYTTIEMVKNGSRNAHGRLPCGNWDAAICSQSSSPLKVSSSRHRRNKLTTRACPESPMCAPYQKMYRPLATVHIYHSVAQSSKV
jgi:hypothetical protein